MLENIGKFRWLGASLNIGNIQILVTNYRKRSVAQINHLKAICVQGDFSFWIHIQIQHMYTAWMYINKKS